MQNAYQGFLLHENGSFQLELKVFSNLGKKFFEKLSKFPRFDFFEKMLTSFYTVYLAKLKGGEYACAGRPSCCISFSAMHFQCC